MRVHRPSPRSHGFTLVELMVALSGGLFLSMMVFALSRDTSRFYQRENRLAAATLAGMSGFERLKADIARAGYLTTPNIAADPKVCMTPVLGWPAQLAGMGSLRINPDAPNLGSNAAMVLATLTPDEIVLAGSYAVTDEFPLRSVDGPNQVTLEPSMGPMARLGYLNPGLDAAGQTAILAAVFRPGRVLRVTNKAGLMFFGVIANATGGPNPTIALNGAPPLQLSGAGTGCGLSGSEKGASANVINFVRYQIRDLRLQNLARFLPVFTQSAGAPGEMTRTELVRDELNAAGAPIEVAGDLTTELVAEYAVDLGFSVTAQLPGANALVDVQPGSANFATIFAAAPANVGAPQRVRAVRARLSVRSREADRESNVTLGGLYRFQLPDGVPGSRWARVRTFQADIALPNQLEVRWPP
jgi:hypothetical protein